VSLSEIFEKRITLLQAKRIAKNLTDPRMKSLLKVILADERRNHKTLVTLMRTIAVEEKVSEDDSWTTSTSWQSSQPNAKSRKMQPHVSHL
jgi:hypothetical protein